LQVRAPRAVRGRGDERSDFEAGSQHQRPGENPLSNVPQSPVPVEEDLVHNPGSDPRWRESYYFSFYDPASGIGAFSSIGKRAKKGQSGHIVGVWGADRPTLVAIDTDTFENHDNDHQVAGLTYRCEEPFARWHIGFEGSLNDGGSE